MIRIDVLGPVRVEIDGQPAPRELLWRKNLGLLLYLARSPHGRRSRDSLMTMFWGDKPEADARHSLNEALRVIRKALPDGALVADRDMLRIDPASVSFDLEDFTELLKDGEPEAASELVRGAFAEGLTIPGSNEFDDWLSGERRQWRRLSAEALVNVAEERLADADLVSARAVARRAAAIDPVAEAPASILMRCDAIAGDRTAALEAYQNFAERLERDLGIEPPEDLAQLAETIRSQRTLADASTRAEEPGLSRRMPMVGRGEALKTSMAVVRSCAGDGQPALLMIVGGAGTGKSRLAEEIISRAWLDGFRTASVRCDAIDRETDHGALRALSSTTELFCDDPAWADPRAFAAALTTEGGRGPVLIWIDDAHFLDTRSFEVLGPLIRDLQGKPVLFLLSGTTAPPSPDLDGAAERVGHDAEGAVVALGPLDEAEMKRMAKAALPDWPDEAIDRLLRRLMRDTGGYPLLAVDMLHALRLSLDLPEEAGTWPAPTHTLDDSFPGALPEPLVAAIRVGYRRLSADAQKVLAVAALIEGRATPDVLRRATELDEQAILDALDELEWRRWLAAEPRGYTFIAHLHRDVILTDLLTRGQRQRLEDRLA